VKIKNKQVRSKKIRNGDRVVAIAGNHKGLFGTVKGCVNGDRVIVEGLNLVKKHIKRSEQHPRGRIIDIEKPIHISNLKILVDDNVAVKLKVRSTSEGERQLVYKSGEQETVYRSIKKPK